MVRCAEGPRRGARVGENRPQKQVEARRRQKWSKAMPTEITTEGGEEDSLSSPLGPPTKVAPTARESLHLKTLAYVQTPR